MDVTSQETDFDKSDDTNEWSRFDDDVPILTYKYKRKIKPFHDKRYYCGVNIDCTSQIPVNRKPGNNVRIRRL